MPYCEQYFSSLVSDFVNASVMFRPRVQTNRDVDNIIFKMDSNIRWWLVTFGGGGGGDRMVDLFCKYRHGRESGSHLVDLSVRGRDFHAINYFRVEVRFLPFMFPETKSDKIAITEIKKKKRNHRTHTKPRIKPQSS